MAPQGDRIAMIGEEGFSMIDKHFYAGAGQVHSRHQTQHRRSYHYASHHQNQQKELQPCVYYGPRTATVVTVKVPAAMEATSYYYGGSNQPAGREEELPPVMTCDEAAQKFGGLVIADHGARRSRRRSSASSQLGF